MAGVRNAFAVNISSIAGKPGQRVDAEGSSTMEGLTTSGGHVPSDTLVNFVGHVSTIDGGFVAEGQVTSKWAGECRRCLGEASGDIDARIREVFEKHPTEGDTYPIDGDYVELEGLVREAAMLELPVAPLCRPDCAGLCATCGANKNEVDCGHVVVIQDDRWAALDALKEN